MYEWDETNKHLIGIYNDRIDDCKDVLTKEQVKNDIEDYKECIKYLKEKLKEMK
jgi:hypothetical protein